MNNSHPEKRNSRTDQHAWYWTYRRQIYLSCVIILAGTLALVSLPSITAQSGHSDIFIPAVTEGGTPAPTPEPHTPTPTPTNTTTSTPTSTPTATPTVTSTPETFDEMVLIPEGTFQMGCDVATDGDCRLIYRLAELPLHEIYLHAYFIDKYEVTNGRYQACVADGSCTPPSSSASGTRSHYYGNPIYEHYPVTHVSWSQAAEFCAWEGKRLPTEAEWEKAARGDMDTRMFPWGNLTSEPFHLYKHGGISVSDTIRVGSLPLGKSPYGLYDMSGNVQEWVNDWYYAFYYVDSPKSNPPGASESFPYCSSQRSARGSPFTGQFKSDYRLTRRAAIVPEQTSETVGFRCAQSVIPIPASPTPMPNPIPPQCGEISGILDTDTALTPYCEYHVPDNILVEQDVTLTIGEGTRLSFAPGVYMRVDGALQAIGSEESPVVFSSQHECAPGWRGIRIMEESGDSSVLRHAIIEHGLGTQHPTQPYVLTVANGASPELSHLMFRYNRHPLNIRAGNITIANSEFISNTGIVAVLGRNNSVQNSVFRGNNSSPGVIQAPPSITIHNSHFSDNDSPRVIYLRGDSFPYDDVSTILSNTIESNTGTAITIETSDAKTVTIQANEISGNSRPLFGGNWCSYSVNHNNFHDNEVNGVTVRGDSCDVDLTNNWWGTADRDEIEEMIVDYYDDFELSARAIFEPFATEPWSDVGMWE